MTIDVWKPSNTQWDEYWRLCPSAMYFQGREWAEIWAEYSHGRMSPSPIGCTFADGQKVIIPLSREKVILGLSRVYHLSPAGTFGGWLSPSSLSREKQDALGQFLVGRYLDLEWRMNPYECTQELQAARIDYTYRLDLSMGFEAVYRRWTGGHARAVRKARREGVEVALAHSAEEWADYYDAYTDTLARWGEAALVRYRRELFDIIASRSSPHVKLFLAKYGSRTIAGVLCLYSPRIAVVWHDAVLAEYFPLKPVHLLMYEAIRRAADEGFQWFDFNPSGWLDGVAAFKRFFGAAATRADHYSARSARTRALAKLAHVVKKATRYRSSAAEGPPP